MHYYEVLVADGRYHSDKALTYGFKDKMKPRSVVTIPLRQAMVTGFVTAEVEKPSFNVKSIKAKFSEQLLPAHCLGLARWLQDYYACSAGEALRQFAPTKPTIRRAVQLQELAETGPLQLELDKPLTPHQKKAVNTISKNKLATSLLHGDSGTGKTRVYLELAQSTLSAGKSVILLTPEIALTSQLAAAVEQLLPSPAYVLHSQLTTSQRKKIWLAVLESTEPVIIIGPRSALFAPVQNPGLIVVDEAHEPAYKQEHAPRYHTNRVASQLAALAGSRVILGTATPSVTDYFLASARHSIARMTQKAVNGSNAKVVTEIIDSKDRKNFTTNPYLSNQLIESISKTLSAKAQVMLYLNRRGTARLILCRNCGWEMLCPNCDIPLVYHGDHHQVRCHTCGHQDVPPQACPSCGNPDIIYRSMGTKALAETVAKLYPEFRVQRFDSDNIAGERVHEVYSRLKHGEIDILVGTQLLAKGFDLPKLGLVGIIASETSAGLPDFSATERAYQLTNQVIGRVGRGHGQGHVVVQSYEPDNAILQSATASDWPSFYKYILAERKAFKFPPFAYLLKLSCRRATLSGANAAAEKLKERVASLKLPVEIIGPAPSFYGRRGRYFYWQLVVKSKARGHLVTIAKSVPSDWIVDLDPTDLL